MFVEPGRTESLNLAFDRKLRANRYAQAAGLSPIVGLTPSHEIRRNSPDPIADPFDDADRKTKFADCCAGMPGAGDLYARLADIDTATDLAFLLSEPAAAGRA